MKNLMIIAVLLLGFTASAQINKPKEVAIKMSKGKQQGWKILIPEANLKVSLRQWTKLMKQYDSKTSKISKNKEYISKTSIIPSLSERAIVVYSVFDETPEGTYLTVFFDLGGAYLNSQMHQDKVKATEKLLMDFARDVAGDVLEKQVKEEEHKLEKLEKEDKRLRNKQSDYEREIQECEARIAQRRKDLEENKQAQEKKQEEIKEQKEAVDSAKAKKKKVN